MDVKYIDNNENLIKKDFDILPIELSKGEELSKL